jgi:hypothetical protein
MSELLGKLATFLPPTAEIPVTETARATTAASAINFDTFPFREGSELASLATAAVGSWRLRLLPAEPHCGLVGRDCLRSREIKAIRSSQPWNECRPDSPCRPIDPVSASPGFSVRRRASGRSPRYPPPSVSPCPELWSIMELSSPLLTE